MNSVPCVRRVKVGLQPARSTTSLSTTPKRYVQKMILNIFWRSTLKEAATFVVCRRRGQEFPWRMD